MADYINRNELLEDIEYYISHTNDEDAEHYAYKTCKRIIENMPAADVVSRGVLDQIRWERDVAIEQLAEYGICFGEKKRYLAKVRHGKWIKHRDEYDCEYIECSVCGENFYPPENAFEFDILPKYCQECGAKMDNERK